MVRLCPFTADGATTPTFLPVLSPVFQFPLQLPVLPLHAQVTILAMLSLLCLVLLSHEPNTNLSPRSDEGATTPPNTIAGSPSGEPAVPLHVCRSLSLLLLVPQAIKGSPRGLFTLLPVSHLRARTCLETRCWFPKPVLRLHVMVNLVSPETESSLVADPQVLILVYRTMVTLKGATPTPATFGSREVLAGTHHLRRPPWLFLIRRQMVRLCLFAAETFLPALSLVFQIPLQLPVLPLHALVILAMLSLPCPVLLSHEPNANLQSIIGYPHGLFTLHSVSHLRARTFLETHCLFPTPVSRLHVMINLVSPGMESSVVAEPPVLCRPHLLFLFLMIRTLVTLEGAMPTPATIGSREVLAGTHHLLRRPWLFLLRRQWRLYTQVQAICRLSPLHAVRERTIHSLSLLPVWPTRDGSRDTHRLFPTSVLQLHVTITLVSP